MEQPDTRRKLLDGLKERGYDDAQLTELIQMVEAEKSDLYDVLAYVAFARTPICREERVDSHRDLILAHYQDKQLEFVDFILDQYIKQGVGELEEKKLPQLIELKYDAVTDAVTELGSAAHIRQTFIGFQKHLYARQVAA